MTLWRLHKRDGSAIIVDDAERARLDTLKRRQYVGAERAVIHVCDHCGSRDAWRESWGWYGSYADFDEGRPITKWCSESCRLGLVAARRVPKTAPRLDD